MLMRITYISFISSSIGNPLPLDLPKAFLHILDPLQRERTRIVGFKTILKRQPARLKDAPTKGFNYLNGTYILNTERRTT